MNKDIQTLIEREAEKYTNNCDLDFSIESKESLNEYHKVEINRAFKKGYDTYRENLKVDKPFSDMIHLAANDRWVESGYSCEDEEATNCYLDFQAGANFALSLFKWRNVSEGLPEQDESLLIDTTRNAYKGGKVGVIKTTQVIVRYKNNTYDIAERCKCVGDSYFWWSCHESFDKNDDMFITHWMPIPQID